MPERGTIDAMLILRRMQEEYHAMEKKLYMSFVDLEKALDKVPRNVLEWAMRKKEIPEVKLDIKTSKLNLEKTKVNQGFHSSE